MNDLYTRHKQAIEWFGLKTKINNRYVGGSGHFFPRGAIVTVLFGENIGYEKSGVRPAICISNDTNNKKSGNIAVVPLTDLANKESKPLLPTQYILYMGKYKYL